MALTRAARIPGAAFSHWSFMIPADRLKRLRFRAWHRGVREADYMVGGFFDAHGASWGDEEMDWFEALLEEQDADIMAWAIGTAEPPERYRGSMMRRLKLLNYIKHPE
jgi:antitoxin CptB